MGSKPWFKLSAFVMAGAVVCGCQSSQRNNSSGPPLGVPPAGGRQTSQVPPANFPVVQGGAGAAYNPMPAPSGTAGAAPLVPPNPGSAFAPPAGGMQQTNRLPSNFPAPGAMQAPASFPAPGGFQGPGPGVTPSQVGGVPTSAFPSNPNPGPGPQSSFASQPGGLHTIRTTVPPAPPSNPGLPPGPGLSPGAPGLPSLQ